MDASAEVPKYLNTRQNDLCDPYTLKLAKVDTDCYNRTTLRGRKEGRENERGKLCFKILQFLLFPSPGTIDVYIFCYFCISCLLYVTHE